MSRFHPWRLARELYKATTIEFHPDLPVVGDADGRTIRLRTGLSQAQRRSVLTHELVHTTRGTTCGDSYLAAKEERVVDQVAARLLITLDDLVDALAWTRGVANRECAWELWTDLHTLRVRISSLTADERRYIDDELQRRQP